ncbi:MAG: hypothetical protein DYG90_08890 [Chloroflexi bacterium CFX6]|nr:hypothetical protein [Chloroflexi bacterium CFX6]
MPSLLDREQGYAAFAVRRALHREAWAELQALRRRVAELERALVLDLRVYTGLTINDHGTHITLDHRRRHHIVSTNDSVNLDRVEGKPYGIDITVNVDAIIEEIKTLILADPDFLDELCNWCGDPTPGPG